MLRMILVIFGTAAVVVGMLGFRGQLTQNRPWHVFWDMKYQAKYTPQAQARFFSDGRTMRTPVGGTVAYSANSYFDDAGSVATPNPDVLRADDEYYRGLTGPAATVDGRLNYVANVPPKAIEIAGGWDDLLKRGQERYNINCSMCHGVSGGGGSGEAAHGIVGRYGLIGIANYHDDRLRKEADGHLFHVITNGWNSMSSYGHQVRVQDRWAIVAYIRALQLSQYAEPSLSQKPATGGQ